jgi:hypothetical protein
LDVEVGGAITPSLGGDVAGCSSCDRSIAGGGRAMARAGRTIGSALTMGLDAGYFFVGQDVDRRRADVLVLGYPTNSGNASDALAMRGAMLGLSIAYRLPWLGESFARAGAGSFLGSVRDERQGEFNTAAQQPYPVKQTQQQPAVYGYASLAFGLRFRQGPHFRVGAGLEAIAMVALRQPEWDSSCGSACTIWGARDGESWFPNDALAGRFVLLVSPFVNAGYAF